MEKKDNRIFIEIENFPHFGTSCSVFDKKNYFVQLIPREKQIKDLKNSYLTIDPFYHKKETFYIYFNSAREGGEGINKT